MAVGVCVAASVWTDVGEIVGIEVWVLGVAGDEVVEMVKFAVSVGRISVIVDDGSGAAGEQEETVHAIQAAMMQAGTLLFRR